MPFQISISHSHLFKRQYCHNVMNESFVCLHLNDCCVFVQSDVLRIWMDFKLVEVRWFCFHINLHACTVILKTLTALQSTIHDCLNQKLIPYSMKWGLPDKMLFSFTWLVFSPPYKAPASTPPEFCFAILLFYLLFLLPWLDMFRKRIQSIM